MIARFLTLALLAMLAGCAAMASGGGLIPRKGGDNGGPIHCHGARC
jgi:hypothetical protein